MVQSLGGIVLFGDSVSVESGSGLVLCMVGSGVYVKVKSDIAKAQSLISADEPLSADETNSVQSLEEKVLVSSDQEDTNSSNASPSTTADTRV